MKRGFTLVEMLVVIGIIAILIGAGMTSFSTATKKAQKAHAQELVTSVATALEAVYQKEGAWPRKILANGSGEGKLDEDVAYELAVRNMMSLTYDTDKKKTTGSDRFGVVTPWAQKVIGRRAGTGISTGTAVPSGGTIEKHIIRYAVDTEGQGFVNAVVGGVTVRIRGTAVAWCCGADGEIEPYIASGGGGDKGESSKGGGRSDDVYSWSRQQVVK